MSVDATAMNGTDDVLVEYVTVRIAEQLFGLPILEVEDVFAPQNITQVPLSMGEVAGVLNLRGRIVTAIDMRTRLQLPSRKKDESSMAVGIEHNGESYGLIVDSIGEVLRVKKDGFEPNPTNLNPNWIAVSGGVYQLERELMVVLDVARVMQVAQKQERQSAPVLGIAV